MRFRWTGHLQNLFVIRGRPPGRWSYIARKKPHFCGRRKNGPPPPGAVLRSILNGSRAWCRWIQSSGTRTLIERKALPPMKPGTGPPQNLFVIRGRPPGLLKTPASIRSFFILSSNRCAEGFSPKPAFPIWASDWRSVRFFCPRRNKCATRAGRCEAVRFRRLVFFRLPRPGCCDVIDFSDTMPTFLVRLQIL